MASRRSHARWLAPLALVACAIAVYLVASSGTKGDTDSPATTTAASTERARSTSNANTQSTGATSTPRRTSPRRYTIKSGDTLSAIAASTGVSVDAILRLNPGVEAQALQTGQTLKLSP